MTSTPPSPAPPQSRRRRWLKILLALLLGGVAAAGLAEAVLRIHNPLTVRLRGNRITLPTNVRYEIENTRLADIDRHIVNSRNQLGFRGPNPPEDFDDHLTLVAVGGSTTECFYLSDGDTWPEILGGLLAEELDDVWVNNAGLDGHSTLGHRLLLEQMLVPLKPDYVLFLIGANDKGRDDLNDYERRFSGLKHALLKHSELVNTLRLLWLGVKARWFEVHHRQIRWTELDQLTTPAHTREARLRRHTNGLRSFEERLQGLVERCRATGIEPILVTQPSPVGVGVDDVTGVDLARVKAYGVDGETSWSVAEAYNDVTRQVGGRNEVRVIDLAALMPKSTRYYYDYLHFTRSGSRKVAQILAEELIPWLRDGRASPR